MKTFVVETSYYRPFLACLCVRLLGVDTSDITYVPNVYVATDNYCLVCTLMLARTQDGLTVGACTSKVKYIHTQLSLL